MDHGGWNDLAFRTALTSSYSLVLLFTVFYRLSNTVFNYTSKKNKITILNYVILHVYIWTSVAASFYFALNQKIYDQSDTTNNKKA